MKEYFGKQIESLKKDNTTPDLKYLSVYLNPFVIIEPKPGQLQP